ncbi:hypothetical protein TorRG33x02_314870 [Trema orientale]|uniref:Uncharacterized protein n=1 Tax=Trema orientale TaxID=63057 RepID=A0A2P5BNH1_TREOI|nr:hypothetical protein TorRG33x02_314870 [Trema orientale]
MFHCELESPLNLLLINHKLALKRAHRQTRVPIHQFKNSPPIILNHNPKVIRVFRNPVPEIIRNPKQQPAMINLTQRNPLPGGHHQQLTYLSNPIHLHGIHNRPLLFEKLLHEIGEPEPHLAVIVAIRLENQRMALDEPCHLSSTGESELAVELSGIVEAENVVGLLGEELLGPDEESEEGVTLDDALQRWDSIGLGLDQLGSRAFLLLPLLPEFFRGFGDEEGGGEMGSEEGEVIRVLERSYRVEDGEG